MVFYVKIVLSGVVVRVVVRIFVTLGRRFLPCKYVSFHHFVGQRGRQRGQQRNPGHN